MLCPKCGYHVSSVRFVVQHTFLVYVSHLARPSSFQFSHLEFPIPLSLMHIKQHNYTCFIYSTRFSWWIFLENTALADRWGIKNLNFLNIYIFSR